MDAREKMIEMQTEFANAIVNDQSYMTTNIEEAAGHAIAIVREALLSEDSIRWTASAAANSMADMVEEHARYTPLGDVLDEPLLLASSEAALTAALDTAFGAEPPRQETRDRKD